MKRAFSILVACFLMVAVMAGISSARNITLNVPVPDGAGANALRILAQEYEEETGVKVNIIGYNYDEIHQRTMLDFHSRTGRFDVIGYVYQWYGEYVGTVEHLEPLDSYLNNPQFTPINLNDYSEAVLNIYSIYNGKVYGIPWLGDVHLLAYNTRMLEEAGLQVPTSWEELVEIGRNLMRDIDGDGRIDQYGFGLMGGRIGQSAGTFTSILYSLGGEYLNEDNEPQFDSPAAYKAMDIIVNGLRPISPPDCSVWDFGENVEAFIQGTTALALFWSGSASIPLDPNQSRVHDEVDYSVFPSNVALLGGWSFGISKYSKNKDAAYEFIAWFASEEVQKRYAEYGGAPVSLSALTDPELVKKHPWFPMMKEALEVAKPFPNVPQTEQLIGAMAEEVNNAVSGVKTPEQAVQDLQRRAVRIMEQ